MRTYEILADGESWNGITFDVFDDNADEIAVHEAAEAAILEHVSYSLRDITKKRPPRSGNCRGRGPRGD